MPRLGTRPPEFAAQCTARSKRSGVRCRNYACRGRTTCRMHGGTSRRGTEHPNYRTGRYSDPIRKTAEAIFKPRPLVVKVNLFPRPLKDVAAEVGRGKRLDGLIVPPESVTDEEWMDALRAARRLLARELAEFRADAAGGR